MRIAVIGGGAAGFFAAIAAKESYPAAQVVIFEKSYKLLAKVLISGGGRCNVTNACGSVEELCKAYPRGGRSLKKAFYIFSNQHAMEWFESRSVPLMVQDDERVFPASQQAQSIYDCLTREAGRLGIEIVTGAGVKAAREVGEGLELQFSGNDTQQQIFDRVIVATGGSPQRSGLEWLESLKHRIEDPVPSLFSFNMPGESITSLMGVSSENTLVRIKGTKLISQGPLLITHWGMSGPAILKLSSFGARILSEMGYNFQIQVNWAQEPNSEIVAEQLRQIADDHRGKTLANYRPYALTTRLWQYLIDKIDLPQDRTWGELGKKGINKLMNILTNDEYQVKGRTTFREEFVTCGGVSLESVDLTTMRSKVCRNLFFAGEILDIDGITGGFNFQAAWTTGYIAGRNCCM
jgi:predicted Rossmann fold flavoprotein